MKKIYMAFLAAILFYASTFAQKGNNRIGVGADLSLPTSDFGTYFKTGIGVYAKGMFGVGKSGQVTFTGGYSSFKEAGTWEDFTTTITIVPLLVGYRHHFHGVFVEPQIGYGVYGNKVNSVEEGFFTESGGAFTWAAGVGYTFTKQIEVSARYQTGGQKGINFGLFGLRLGYNFSVGGSK
jgi:Outer membrane protein beta-barrel domain